MQMTNEQYAKYVKKMSRNSALVKDMLNAFWIGGLICVIGQLVRGGLTALGLDELAVGAGTAVLMVLLGASFTGMDLYDDIAKVAGAGTVVPITGFANAIVSPAMEFRSEGLVTGLGAKMFTVAGPVLVYGVSASVVYGLIYWIWTVLL